MSRANIALSGTQWAKCAFPRKRSTVRKLSVRSKTFRSAAFVFLAHLFAPSA